MKRYAFNQILEIELEEGSLFRRLRKNLFRKNSEIVFTEAGDQNNNPNEKSDCEIQVKAIDKEKGSDPENQIENENKINDFDIETITEIVDSKQMCNKIETHNNQEFFDYNGSLIIDNENDQESEDSMDSIEKLIAKIVETIELEEMSITNDVLKTNDSFNSDDGEIAKSDAVIQDEPSEQEVESKENVSSNDEIQDNLPLISEVTKQKKDVSSNIENQDDMIKPKLMEQKEIDESKIEIHVDLPLKPKEITESDSFNSETEDMKSTVNLSEQKPTDLRELVGISDEKVVKNKEIILQNEPIFDKDESTTSNLDSNNTLTSINGENVSNISEESNSFVDVTSKLNEIENSSKERLKVTIKIIDNVIKQDEIENFDNIIYVNNDKIRRKLLQFFKDSNFEDYLNGISSSTQLPIQPEPKTEIEMKQSEIKKITYDRKFLKSLRNEYNLQDMLNSRVIHDLLKHRFNIFKM